MNDERYEKLKELHAKGKLKMNNKKAVVNPMDSATAFQVIQ